jgi:hypothetical protein
MRELLARGKNTIDPEVIDPGGRSVEDSPVKSDYVVKIMRERYKNYTVSCCVFSKFLCYGPMVETICHIN